MYISKPRCATGKTKGIKKEKPAVPRRASPGAHSSTVFHVRNIECWPAYDEAFIQHYEWTYENETPTTEESSKNFLLVNRELKLRRLAG